MTKFDLLTRRSVVIGALGAVIAGTLAGAGGAEEGGDTGLIREDWFLASAFDLGADLRLAASRNKRLAVLWEVNGNPLCAETHIKTLGDAAIAAFIHARFEIVQFDAAGVRDITDFDGEKLPEKALAAKYGVRMTPTLQFCGHHRCHRRQAGPPARGGAPAGLRRAAPHPGGLPLRCREGLRHHAAARLSQGATDLKNLPNILFLNMIF